MARAWNEKGRPVGLEVAKKCIAIQDAPALQGIVAVGALRRAGVSDEEDLHLELLPDRCQLSLD
jgi:hypothetical protein